MDINQKLQSPGLQEKIKEIENQFLKEVCSDLPNAFWDRKRHIVSLPYNQDFNEKHIPTKARPSQMKSDYLELCKKEIQTLLDKKLIRKSYSPWSCTLFMFSTMQRKNEEFLVLLLIINH